jgi:sulfoxide reductase heme-binding subunit YedZ
MKYRGFSSTTVLARWGLVAVGIGIVLGGTAPSALRQLADLLTSQGGMVPWVSSRLLAFIAYGAIAGSVIYGLLLSTKLLDAVAHRPITFTLHQDLAAVGLGLAGIHGALLGLDRTVPASIGELAIPFATTYRPLWVGFGQLAFWLSAAVVASFYLRRRIGQRAWRLLHYATFLAFVGATAHGIGAGTDSSGPARWIYLGPTVVVVFLLAYRIALSTVGRSARTTAATPLLSDGPPTP